MIPNLTIIVASYVFMRLVTMVLRQFPAVEQRAACTTDTLGVGLSVGSALDAKRGRPF